MIFASLIREGFLLQALGLKGLFVEPLSLEAFGFEGFSSKTNAFEWVIVCSFVLIKQDQVEIAKPYP